MNGCLMIVCMSLKANSKGFCLELDTTSLLDPLENSGSEEDMTLVKILSHEYIRELIFACLLSYGIF